MDTTLRSGRVILLELVASEAQLVSKGQGIPISRSTRSMAAYIVLNTISGSSVTPAMLRNYCNVNPETVRLFLRLSERFHMIRFIDRQRKSIRANFSMIKSASDFSQSIVEKALKYSYCDENSDLSWLNALTKLHLMDAVPVEENDFMHLHRSTLKRGLAAYLSLPKWRKGAVEADILDAFPMSREALRIFRGQLSDQGLIRVSKSKMGVTLSANQELIKHMADMSDKCMMLVSDYQNSGASLEAFGLSAGLYSGRNETAQKVLSVHNQSQTWVQVLAKFSSVG